MTYPITDDFSDPRGRWDVIAPWDVTEAYQSTVAVLASQEHVDLRCFLNVANLVAVPQTDLEAPVEQTTLDAEQQTALEQKLGDNLLDEAWTLANAQGVTNSYTNMVLNGSFETNTTNWALSGFGAFARSATWAAIGTESLAVTNPGVAQETDSDPIAASPGTYTFSIYINNQMNDTCRINLAYSTDGGGTWQQDGSGLFDSTFAAAYNARFTQTVTAPVGTTHMKLRLIVDGARTGSAYFDGVMLETGSTAHAYVDNGTYGGGDLAIGKIAARGGWSGAQFTCTGGALAADLDSILTTGIDISHEDSLSIIFPDHNSFTAATSYVQLTSSPLGFGHGADSAQVFFSANTAAMPHLKLNIASFANAGFDNTSVKGVRIHFVEAAPAASALVTVLAIRAIKSTWVESALDFNTRLGALVPPVTLDGNIYAGSNITDFEFVRGDNSKQDPVPADLVMNVFFTPGGGTSPNDATGVVYNRVGLIFREIHDGGAGTGSHLEATLNFNDTTTFFEAKRVDTTGGSPPGATTAHGDYTETVGAALDALKNYRFQVEVKGTQIDAQLWETDINHVDLSLVWKLTTTLTDSNYVYRQGRVGFISSLVSRDAYVDELLVSPTGFASLTTEVFNTRTPVDGGQLTAISAPDSNLWSGFTGVDIFIDNTKTISGFGSFRTSLGVTSNTFIVDDWTNTYLDISLWVPTNVTLTNQPQIVLNTGTGTENLVMPKLQPGQWNTLHFDLGNFRDQLTGVGYSFSVLAASTPDKALGNFWIDSVTLGRRRVAWSMRATANGPWRQFKDMLNNPSGAVHLPHDERGTMVQLRAEALTEDAWVSSFKLIPRYAQLGLPLWDQAFDSA